jgi:hypothetical protein
MFQVARSNKLFSTFSIFVRKCIKLFMFTVYKKLHTQKEEKHMTAEQNVLKSQMS